MIYKSFQQIIDAVDKLPQCSRMAVAAADDRNTIEAVVYARRKGVVEPVLVGNRAAIINLLEEMGESVLPENIIDAADSVEAAKKAVEAVKSENANFLFKGNLETKHLLKAVVDKDKGLGTGRTMSHFTVFDVPGADKLLAPVDGGMIPYPTLQQKKDIINNSVTALKALGYECPKVGVLACVEKINPSMPETIEASKLKQMNQSGEITDCIVEGPISYDCAMNKEIAAHKRYESPCAGDCDILLAPNIHAGNIMGKMLTVTCGAKMAGIIMGARCPIA